MPFFCWLLFLQKNTQKLKAQEYSADHQTIVTSKKISPPLPEFFVFELPTPINLVFSESFGGDVPSQTGGLYPFSIIAKQLGYTDTLHTILFTRLTVTFLHPPLLFTPLFNTLTRDYTVPPFSLRSSSFRRLSCLKT